MKRLVLFLAVVGLIACVGTRKVELTPQDHEFLDRLDSVETTFSLPAEVSDIAWERARSFIDRYSWTSLHSVTDGEIRTFNPSAGTQQCGYVVTRRPEGEDVEFSVQCVAGHSSYLGTADRNARILALYMKTGELPPDPKKLISH